MLFNVCSNNLWQQYQPGLDLLHLLWHWIEILQTACVMEVRLWPHYTLPWEGGLWYPWVDCVRLLGIQLRTVTECSTAKEATQSQLRGSLGGHQPYHRHKATWKAPYSYREKPWADKWKCYQPNGCFLLTSNIQTTPWVAWKGGGKMLSLGGPTRMAFALYFLNGDFQEDGCNGFRWQVKD